MRVAANGYVRLAPLVKAAHKGTKAQSGAGGSDGSDWSDWSYKSQSEKGPITTMLPTTITKAIASKGVPLLPPDPVDGHEIMPREWAELERLRIRRARKRLRRLGWQCLLAGLGLGRVPAKSLSGLGVMVRDDYDNDSDPDCRETVTENKGN